MIRHRTASRRSRSPRHFETQLTVSKQPGKEYYDFRAALMVRNNEGLTKTYNRFHDPDEAFARYHQAPRVARRRWTAPSSMPTAGPT